MKTSAKIRDVPRIAGTSIAVILKEARSTRIGGRKILLSGLVYATLYVALQSKVYSWLDKPVFDKLNKTVIDPSSVVGPAKNLISRSMMGGIRDPHSYTSGKLIADLIANRRKQIRIPREPSPRPEFRIQQSNE